MNLNIFTGLGSTTSAPSIANIPTLFIQQDATPMAILNIHSTIEPVECEPLPF